MQFNKSFLPSFFVLFVAEIICFAIGFSFQNNDSREILIRLPIVVLVVVLVVPSVYSFLFATIDQIYPSEPKKIIRFSAILGLILVVHAYLYHSVEIDWLAINNGVKELTLYQSVVKSDFTVVLISTSFLVIHLVQRLSEKKKSS